MNWLTTGSTVYIRFNYLNQCCQPSRPSDITEDGTGRRLAVRHEPGRNGAVFFEAGRGRTEGTAVNGKFPSPAVPGRHRPTSIDDLRVIIHNRYSVIISTFLHYLDCEARSFNICSIRTWMLTTNWESRNIDKSIYILYRALYSFSICNNSNRPMSAGDGDDGRWRYFCRPRPWRRPVRPADIADGRDGWQHWS